MRQFLLLLACCACAPPPGPSAVEPFELAVGQTRSLALALDADGEAFLALTGKLAGASWRAPGNESVTLRIVVDDAVLRHLVWATGSEEQTWKVAVGRLSAGTHTARVEVSSALTRAAQATLSLSAASLALFEDQELARYAPIVRGRDESAFNDSPLLLYGTRQKDGTLVYTVLYTNEDGGTGAEARQLVARWGRLTDIEWVTSAKPGAGGEALIQFQALGHMTLPFDGPREQDHPVVRVATANGTFADDTVSALFRFAPAVVAFDDQAQPRERMMDENPWMHRVAQEEGEREGKVDPACSDPAKVWANRCTLYVDVEVTTQNLPSERRVWGLEAQTAAGAVRSELDLGGGGRLDRDGQVRVAIPVGEGAVSAVRLYAVGDAASAFSVVAKNPRAWRVTDDGVVAVMANPAAEAQVSDTVPSAPLLP